MTSERGELNGTAKARRKGHRFAKRFFDVRGFLGQRAACGSDQGAYAVVYAGLLVSFMVVVTQLALKDAEGGETPARATSMLVPDLAS